MVSDPGTASIVNSDAQLMQINQTGTQDDDPIGTASTSAQGTRSASTDSQRQACPSCEAMNYIGGANPSVIQGTRSANGKVYLVNSNGILFDGTAQVNVNTLIASSLDISQSTFDNGIASSLIAAQTACRTWWRPWC